MGMEIEGADELAILLTQSGGKAVKGVLDQMRKEAAKIQELAQKYAPIDHGNLEDAIKVRTQGGGRDESGRFGRKSISVFIDMNAPAFDGRTVGEYAYVMHEHLLPFGSGGYNLGKHSQAKQAGQSEIVGGRFLERAADDVSKDMMNRLINVARDYF